jgi:hypothetical protein
MEPVYLSSRGGILAPLVDVGECLLLDAINEDGVLNSEIYD